MSDMLIDEQAARELKRFRQLVRSRIRGYAAQQREAPGLTLYVSAGNRASKARAIRVGRARSAAEVAENVRFSMLEAAPGFAALGRPLHSKGARRVGRGFGLVVASRAGLVETWQTTFTAGEFDGWAEGEFDPGVSIDLLRSSWAEVDRQERLRGLLERLRAVAVVPLEDELENAVRWGKCAELAEGVESFLGNPLASAPREPEGEFTDYVERWVAEAEGPKCTNEKSSNV